MNHLRRELAELDRDIDELERMRTEIVNRIDALERGSGSQVRRTEPRSGSGQLLVFRPPAISKQRNTDEEGSR